MRRRISAALLLAASAALAGCDDELPTSVDGGRIPVVPVTAEVFLPWSEFGSDLRIIGGYGTPSELGRGVLAGDFRGLEARTLLRFVAFPRGAQVRDSTGTVQADSSLTFLGGQLLVRFDTLTSTAGGPVELRLSRTLHPWHLTSANWEVAVDTFGVTDPWPVAGGGPVEPVSTGVWDPAEGDSLLLPVDSATVAALTDTTGAGSDGFRLDLLSPGERLDVTGASLRVDARPSVHPDTLIQVAPAGRLITFIYSPTPTAPEDGLRVGGVPAWRSVLDVGVPETLDGPPEVCALVGCPYELRPEIVNHAELVLTTRAVDEAFAPADSLRIDVRAVLAKDLLPKSPLGSPFLDRGKALAPSLFDQAAGSRVTIPVTPFVRTVAADTAVGVRTIALLSSVEPGSLPFAAFAGPGQPGEPVLRLVLTISPRVELP